MALSFSFSSFAKVEACFRPAALLNGLVDHYWLKTDTKTAGMGSKTLTDFANGAQIGDQFEAPFITKVFIVDHSNQHASFCIEKKDIDEDCVNEELDIGKPLGRFGLLNNCQTFVRGILHKCLTPEAREKQRQAENEDLYKG